MRKLKFNLLVIIIVSSFSLYGCNSNLSKDRVEDGLVMSGLTTSYGGELDLTVVSYSFNIWNKTGRSITLKSVEPILQEDLISRLDRTPLINEVNKTITGGSEELIKGSFNVDTQGLDKEGILALNLDLKRFKIITEQELGVEIRE
ncbi:hypothetical protein AWM70_14795 [Paenibacillus yonginensis]|uniref:Uncharacterized protein n=2 Tax=Paenibacillus TaxID=44249 RepID=A0A1B1N2P7_9BACL|nr:MULTISPECIES: hypothetical protein [Paenibacillus]ANS75711.1 hypothetical protein AWM70_14795 [Paenibacillus yonginensis]GGA34665.1 hypothetical protein GCM10010917_19850 [Paenibacillus physcomitrellae]